MLQTRPLVAAIFLVLAAFRAWVLISEWRAASARRLAEEDPDEYRPAGERADDADDERG